MKTLKPLIPTAVPSENKAPKLERIPDLENDGVGVKVVARSAVKKTFDLNEEEAPKKVVAKPMFKSRDTLKGSPVLPPPPVPSAYTTELPPVSTNAYPEPPPLNQVEATPRIPKTPEPKSEPWPWGPREQEAKSRHSNYVDPAAPEKPKNELEVPALEPIKAPESVSGQEMAPTLTPIEKTSPEASKAVPEPVAKKHVSRPWIPQLEPVKRGEDYGKATNPPALATNIETSPCAEVVLQDSQPCVLEAPIELAIPKLEPIQKEKKVEEVGTPEIRKHVILENIIKKDEMFMILGISAAGGVKFHGFYSRGFLAGEDGFDIVAKGEQLLKELYDKEEGEDDWIQRKRGGFCRSSWSLPSRNDTNRYGIVLTLRVIDNNQGRNIATWEGEDTQQADPYVTYRFVIVKAAMNEAIPPIPLEGI